VFDPSTAAQFRAMTGSVAPRVFHETARNVACEGPPASVTEIVFGHAPGASGSRESARRGGPAVRSSVSRAAVAAVVFGTRGGLACLFSMSWNSAPQTNVARGAEGSVVSARRAPTRSET